MCFATFLSWTPENSTHYEGYPCHARALSRFCKICRFVLEDSKEYSEVQFHKLFMFYSNNITIPEEAALSAIDEIIWLLKEGKWQNLREIIENCSSPKSEVKMAVSFLGEYDFIQVDKKGGKVRLRPLMLKFIDGIQRVEREETLSD